jgi:hypothetical protein
MKRKKILQFFSPLFFALTFSVCAGANIEYYYPWLKTMTLAERIEQMQRCSVRDELEKISYSENTLNISFDKCETYMPRAPGQLRLQVQLALEQGLACLQKLGPRRAQDGSRLRALFDPQKNHSPVVIRCAGSGDPIGTDQDGNIDRLAPFATAAASNCLMSDTFPSILLNREFQIEADRMPALLFHEFMHLLGYMHPPAVVKKALLNSSTYDFSVDIVQSAEDCCFHDSAAACAVLRTAKSNIQ